MILFKHKLSVIDIFMLKYLHNKNKKKYIANFIIMLI